MRAPSDLRQHPNTDGKPYPEPLTGKLRVQTTSLVVWFPAFHAQKSSAISIYRKCRNIGFREDCRLPFSMPNLRPGKQPELAWI